MRPKFKFLPYVAAFLVAGCATQNAAPLSQKPTSPFANLPKIAQIDDRFQSYNIEMVEVTGGRFWAPYGGPPGEIYRMRPAFDLSNRRLRQLAQHLKPAYVRVSGTWANSSYLEGEGESLDKPPEGYRQILKRDQWRGLINFAKAVDAPIITSFAVSDGARNGAGVWKVEQAQRLIDLTKAEGGKIAAAEFFNEPNIPALSGLPTGYNAADYGRDFAIFRNWIRAAAPEVQILGPGSAGEGSFAKDIPAAAGLVTSKDMLLQTRGGIDAFSYHYYGALSQRCKGRGIRIAKKDEALSAEWLSGTQREYDYYAALRDQYETGKPIWLTETAQAACGGSPWAKSFRDTFRYVSQNGRLAQKGVKVVMHNTLAASDYALIDEDTLKPRPNYWAAVLWAKLMAPTVLKAPESDGTALTYAHCMRGAKGGVALAFVNPSPAAQRVDAGNSAQAYVLTAPDIDSEIALINGEQPQIDIGGNIKGLKPISISSAFLLPAQSIAYVIDANADNAECT